MASHRLASHGSALVIAALALLFGCNDSHHHSAPVGPDFENPPEVKSSGGVLATTMTVTSAELTVANQDVTFFALYNGLYMPPTLRVQPGDQVQILLQNFAIDPTNLHYHGLAVTPQGTGDNIFLSVEEGDSFLYSFTIPASHPQGLFWYHPHRDPLLNSQISAGMSGAIIIGDILAPFPSLAGIPERVMILKDLKTEDGMPEVDPDPSGPTNRTINGLFQPSIAMTPGQIEFWRIGNQSSNIFYELTFGGQPFHIIGIDGNLQNQVITTDTMVMPPGSRREVLVYGPTAGFYQLQTADFDTGGDSYPGQMLATIDSSGDPVTPIDLPASFPAVPDLRQVPLTGTKTVVFADTANPNQFYIDGKPFSPNCIDYIVQLGSTEEWTIQNTATEAHVFHIHQLDFQVTEVNGEPTEFTGYQDVVTLPAAVDDSTPSEVKIIIPFTDPVMAGKFVYHCHIIQHEDQGMMATIFVQDPLGPPPDSPPCK